MNESMQMKVIGTAKEQKGSRILVKSEYREGLIGLGEFSHIMVLWVFDRAPWDGKTLKMPPVYRKLKHEIGTFATRSPFRPSPVGVTNARILSVDEKEGIIVVDWLDAENGSPVIDIKPYHPSEDVVTDFAMPLWCAHWPRCREESGGFDWEAEFMFN